MRLTRAFVVLAAVAVLAAPASLSARWIDLGGGEPYAEPSTDLLSSGLSGASVDVDIPGVVAEEVSTELGTFTRLVMPGAGVTTAIGSPLLPVLREHFEIPQGAAPTLRILSARYAEVRLADLGVDHRVYPAQPPVEKLPGALEAARLVIDDAAYATDTHSPAVAARLGEIGQVRAHRYAEVEIFPIQYNPVAGTIRYLTHVEIAVDFEGADWAETNAIIERYASPGFDEFARHAFVNAEAFAVRATIPLPIGYLIITYDDYYEEVEMLAGLRHRLGYETTMVRKSDIPNGTTTTGIRAYIQDAYDNWPVPPTFVLLVGDTPQIPAFTGTASYSATDLYYTTMDGASDWLPDIYIGRFSCDSEADVTLLTNKTVEYIRYALASDPADWIKEATFMASNDNYTVSEATHNYVISTWLVPDAYTCYKRYCHTYSATIAQVIADVDGGVSQLTYSGHGSTNSWGDGPAMNASQVQALVNEDMLPFVQSYSCLTGEFDLACFAETWTLAPYGGVAFWGSSTTSYWTEDDILERGVYDAWFGEGYTWIRGMLNEGMWDVYVAYSGGGSTKRYYEQYNLFGDPALDVWTKPYETFDVTCASAFPIGGDTFPIDVSTLSRDPVEGALVCLYMDGEVYETAYTDANGHADIDISTPPTTVGTMDVWVSKHDFKPYSGSVEVIVPVTYEIVPATIPVNQITPVVVTVWDSEGAPLSDVEITIDGWGIVPEVDVTDGSGEAHFTVMPPYGESLTVIGSELSQTYNAFEDVLPVTGGQSFMTADVDASVESIGLYGMLTPFYEGVITGSASETGIELLAVGCGVDDHASSGGATSVDLPVTPTSAGTIHAAIGKKGFNVYLEDIAVEVVYGQMAGEIYEAPGRAPIDGARIKGYPAGGDTTGATPVFEATSGGGGVYVVDGDLEVGYYDVYVLKFGYLTGAEEVFLQYGANDVDFYLDAAPAGVVSGYVTEVGTGRPLEATVKVYRADNMEMYAQVTSDSLSGGYYEVELPYFNYEMNVRAFHHIPQTRGITVDEATESEDFELEPTLANILLISDGVAKGGVDVRIDPKTGELMSASPTAAGEAKSAAQMAADLRTIGYDVVEEAAASTNPSTWLSYDFIISASGDNTSPVADATYRAALESYVTAGGRLLIEGGEVGYDALSYPSYPSFAATVLHAADWEHDESGNLSIYDETHPLTTYPNVLTPIAFAYSSYGDQDACVPAADASMPTDWTSWSGISSTIAYDDDADPTNGQVVFFEFDYLAAGSSGRIKLLENTVVYLTSQGSSPTGGISGTVHLEGETDHSGILVVVEPGGAEAYTNAAGHYEVGGLYAWTYTVTASKEGWSSARVEGVEVGDGQQVGGVDMMLFPVVEYEHCESPGLSIPDNVPAGVYDTLVFTEDMSITDVEVYVDITHTYIGDLIVELTSPEGTTVRLHNRTGGSADNIVGWYDSVLSVDGPGSLSDYIGEGSAGEWELWVSDNAGVDVGVVNDWCVHIWGGVSTGVADGEMGDVPREYVLRGASPNPFNPVTKVEYGLPSEGRVSLRVYNVAGKLVRVLADGVEGAGYHEAVWDGRDGRGESVASGVYFARMEAEGFQASTRMVLLK
jgi:subtilisin-like proprotein convertase family protein